MCSFTLFSILSHRTVAKFYISFSIGFTHHIPPLPSRHHLWSITCGPDPVLGLYSCHLFVFPLQPQVAGLVLSFLLNKEVQRSSVTWLSW